MEMMMISGLLFFSASGLDSVFASSIFLCLMSGVVGHDGLEWVGEESSWAMALIFMTGVMGLVSSICCIPPHKKEAYFTSISLVSFFSVCAFMCEGGLLFFLFFELTFFPICFLILMWGYNKERVVAVLYMGMYSFFGSSFHMVALSMAWYNLGSASFSWVGGLEGDLGFELSVWFLVLTLLFIVKSPLFMWHLWLSKAHVEAPTGASMMLAAVLLKLGLFGLVGYSALVWPSWLADFFQVFGLLGSLYASLVCMRSQNLKLVIAMSSVAHMSLCISGYFCGSEGVLEMCCLMCIVHGFCAAGLFAWAGRHYNFGSSQSGVLVSGQRLLYLDGVCLAVLFLVCNCGIPPFISFWVEAVFFFNLYSVWVGAFYGLVGVSLSCLAFNVVIGLGVFHGGAESSQSKHSALPAIECVSWGAMGLLLVLGYII